MERSAEIQALFDQYQQEFPLEALALQPLAQFLKNSPEFFHRQTLPGHITSSGLIWNPQREQWLLIYHATFQQWQQTGGHSEAEDAHIWETALREAQEETTVQHLQLHPWHQKHNFIPLAIDIHTIPAHPGKQEEQHLHFDWEYLLITTKDAPDTPEQKWVSFAEGLPLVTEPLHYAKVQEILFS